MPRKNTIVDSIRSLSPSVDERITRPAEADQPIIINFEGGETGMLDMKQPFSTTWIEVLDSMHQASLPVYIEIDPSTRSITELLLPMAVKVEYLAPLTPGNDVEVRLSISHARHILKPANPDFQVLLDSLRTALAEGANIYVTETLEEHEIIDVRSAPKVTEAEAHPIPPPPAGPLDETPTVTFQQAQNFFNDMNAQTCDPCTAPLPCIPFKYPDDGCWGRAHEMCRLMQAAGASPEKIWIYGSLHVRSNNKPTCDVYWGWHVAPTLLVDLGSSTETFVIDPSLFTEPVRKEQWKSVQGYPNAILEPSAAEVFYRSQGAAYVTYDPSYTQTNTVLTTYRNYLKLRCAQEGSPPYNACVPDIYVRDNLQDTGLEPLAAGGISASPDINHFRQELADPQATLGTSAAQGMDNLFEPIEFGQPNYIYLRLQNRGNAATVSNIDVYYALPSTLPTPASWNLIGSLTTLPIVPGEFRVVGPLVWNNIPQQGHYCFVAVLDSAQDPKPNLNAIHTINDFYALIREHNNVTWKNFDVIDMFAGATHQLEFWIQGWPRIPYLSDLEIDLSQLPPGTKFQLQLVKRLVQGAELENMTLSEEKGAHALFDLHSHKKAALRNMPLKPSDRTLARLEITLPEFTPDGGYQVSVLQKVGGQEMGRVTQRLRVGEYPYVVNANSDEVHLANCAWVQKMNPRHRIAYRDLELARRHGHNGCHFCLPESDTG